MNRFKCFLKTIELRVLTWFLGNRLKKAVKNQDPASTGLVLMLGIYIFYLNLQLQLRRFND